MKLLIVGAILAALIGSWLAYFSFFMQLEMAMSELWAACKKVEEDNIEDVEECFYGAIIKLGLRG